MIDQEVISTKLYSIEAEQSVIGSLMLDNDCFDDVNQVVDVSDFFNPAHKSIYQSVLTLAEAGKPFDPVTMSEVLELENRLEECGGISYLIELVESIPSIANVKAYAQIVKDRSRIRSVHNLADKLKVMSVECESPGEIISEVQELAFSLDSKSSEESEESIAVDVMRKVFSKLDRQYKGEEKPGYMTGLTDLDKRTGGFQGSNLIILAARPSMGKSVTAMNWAVSGAKRGDTPFVFSLEDAGTGFMTRAISHVSGVDAVRLRDGKLIRDDDWPKLSNASAIIKKWPMVIDDSSGLTAGEIRSRARKYARKHGNPKIIFIDHLKQLKFPGKNLVNEIGEATKQFKSMAKEFDCPVVLLCQLNRGVENRSDKRPLLSDLRDSGEIEQDADVVICLYRDEYYNEDSDQKGVLEMITRKGRDIQIGTDKVYADLTRMTLKNLTADAIYSQSGY